jgi:hypothetical protein
MLQTIEVEIEANGHLRLLDEALILRPGRALLTLLEPVDMAACQWAESALSEDWLKPEEDAAWAHLQAAQ